MKIGIIGGGASGLVAAISAARNGAEVTILEGGERIGRKILSTGNGKCNFTNAQMNQHYFRSNTISDISAYLDAFGVDETLRFFEELHMLYFEKNGYYYPLSGQASTVLDALRFEIDRNAKQITVATSQKVVAITYLKNSTVKVSTQDKEYIFDKVILATGSKAAPKLGSDGSGYKLLRNLDKNIQIEPVVPALVQLRCKENYLKAVAGVRTEAVVKLFVDDKLVSEDHGELLLTDYGISGIPVFQVSRFASYACYHKQHVTVCINVMPQFGDKAFIEKMKQRKEAFYNQSLESFCSGLVNKKICQLFCKLSNLSQDELLKNVSDKAFQKFISFFQNWTLTIESANGFDMAQICAGGVSMQEVDTHFALKKYPSIYVVGELLDVDGICGGYNLQWAWASGYLAGKYAALE